MDDRVDIRVAGSESIDRLRELWISLSRHHAAVAPELEEAFGAVRPEDDSWAVRRALYDEWLAEPDAFVLLAETGGRPVGYAVVGHAQRGIGTRLIERMHEELAARGVGQFTVSVIASNSDAVRFYERLGLTPFLVTYAGRVSG